MVTTLRAASIRGYADLARTFGLDPLRMLDAVGIPRAALDDTELRIPTEAFCALLENSARAAEDFGLRLVEARTPSNWGPLNLVIREQLTVRGIIDATTRFSALMDESVLVKLEEWGDVAVLSIARKGASTGPIRQAIEIGVTQLLRLLRRHLGSQWRPLGVCFVYGPPKSIDTHRRILGRDLEFNRDFNGVVFRRTDLDQPNAAADPEMARHLEHYAQGLAASAETSVPDRVHEAVIALLPTGRCTIECTAERLSVDVRTLQRHLASDGTGFLEILQRTRMELADKYIEESDRPLVEVAELLGFSALSAFSRWHHAHYGRPPSERRRIANSH